MRMCRECGHTATFEYSWRKATMVFSAFYCPECAIAFDPANIEKTTPEELAAIAQEDRIFCDAT